MGTPENYEALAEFARRVIRDGWGQFEIDAMNTQEWATELGLTTEKIAKAEDCVGDLADLEPGDTIYIVADWLREKKETA